MSQPELKPCPFCGEQPEVTKHFKRDEYCLIHRCKYIPAHIDFTTMTAILQRWNARTDPASPIHPCPAHLVMPERMLHTPYVAGVIPSNAADVSAHRDGWNACLEEVDRLNASPAAPKGWKLVPTDPEQIQMVHTAFNLSGKYGVDFVSANKEFALDVYREMLDAAPCSDSVCRANCSSKPSYTDVANIHATALELCDVIENKNDLQLHKWALKSAYLVSKLRTLLDDAHEPT